MIVLTYQFTFSNSTTQNINTFETNCYFQNFKAVYDNSNKTFVMTLSNSDKITYFFQVALKEIQNAKADMTMDIALNQTTPLYVTF